MNVASRMESHGIPGAVHLTAAVYERVKYMDCFDFKSLGVSDIKSLGVMETYSAKPKSK